MSLQVNTRKPSPGHTGIVWSIAFSPDGNTLASGSSREIRLWDTVTGEQKGTLTGHEHDVLSLAFSPDGRTLASGGGRWDYTLRLWDVATGVSKGTLTGHTWTVTSLAFSPDGETLASGSGDGTVLLWELTPTREHKHRFTEHTEAVRSVAFSQRLASQTSYYSP